MSFTSEVAKYLSKLKRSNPKVFAQIRKQLVLFETNPKHISLRIHKLSGKLDGSWSLSIGQKLRLIYFIKDGEAWGYDIGTHNEVYRK